MESSEKLVSETPRPFSWPASSFSAAISWKSSALRRAGVLGKKKADLLLGFGGLEEGLELVLQLLHSRHGLNRHGIGELIVLGFDE
jgi:hypothetical protein